MDKDGNPGTEEWEAFERTVMWQYIRKTLTYRLDYLRAQLENPGLPVEKMREFQGRCAEVRFLSTLPAHKIKELLLPGKLSSEGDGQ